jgi:hypothetical protein
MQVLCQSRLCEVHHVYLTYLMLQWQLSHLNSRKLDRHKVSAWYIFCVWIRLIRCCYLILYDFCLLPAQFCLIIMYIQKDESCVQILDQCTPWKVSSGAENLVL